MNDTPLPADYVAVEIAGKAAGIPARTLRHWIGTGKLSAIAGKRGKLVSLGEVARLAVLVGKAPGNADEAPGNPARSADTLAGNVTGNLAGPALVSDAARQQLATIRDEWLAPLIEQLGTLQRENGRLEAERDAQARALAAREGEIAELRRRAEAAEAEVSLRREKEAELSRHRAEAEEARALATRAVVARDAPGASGVGDDILERPARLRARLGRWWRGEP